jgi:ribonuclease P protein component
MRGSSFVSARPTPNPDPDRPERLPLRERRLHTPQMYKKVFESGRVFRTVPLTLRCAIIPSDCTRVGYIIRKKVGNACLRNSIRRTLRQCFAEALPALPEGAWVVFDVPEKARQLRRSELRTQAAGLLAAAGEKR